MKKSSFNFFHNLFDGITTEITYEYNEQGKLIKQNFDEVEFDLLSDFVVNELDGIPDKFIVYEYDEKGNELKRWKTISAGYSGKIT